MINVLRGEIADSYTLIITDANAVMRVHDRMPAIVATTAARSWVVPLADDPDTAAVVLWAWLSEHQIRTLNVAGNRASQTPGIGAFATAVPERALAG